MPRTDTRAASPVPTLLVALLLGGVAAFLLGRLFWPGGAFNGGAGGREEGPDKTAVPRPVAQAMPLAADETARIAVYNRSKGSVVHVTSLSVMRNRFNLNLQQIPRGTGTGFVWDEKGRIVTNYHVVKDADQVRVTLADGSTWNAVQVRVEPDMDLAVIWTDAPKDRLQPLPIGSSHTVQVGQNVLAIGNPFGLDQTLTSGIVSAVGREIEAESGKTIKDMIQTDAAINPGNSGGPLLDSGGRLIGVNSAIVSPSGSFAGIGFAIPVDEVNRVIPRLIRGEQPVRPGLGIDAIPDQWAAERGIEGAIIREVTPAGPADKAGLRPTRRDRTGRIRLGDVIVGIDDRPVRSANELASLLESRYEVGQEVTVHYQRDGETLSTKLSLTAEMR